MGALLYIFRSIYRWAIWDELQTPSITPVSGEAIIGRSTITESLGCKSSKWDDESDSLEVSTPSGDLMTITGTLRIAIGEDRDGAGARCSVAAPERLIEARRDTLRAALDLWQEFENG